MITGGFGVTLDLKRGTRRQWFMRRDGIKRWADTEGAINCPSCEGEGTVKVDELSARCPSCSPPASRN